MPGAGAPLAEPAGMSEAPPLGERAAPVAPSGGALSLVARALQLLVHEPALVARLPEEDDWCPEEEPDGRLCREVIRLLRAGRYRSAQVLLAHFHGSAEGERLAALARRELLIPREARGAELEGLVAHFRRTRQRRSPQEEIDALLARERRGERLSREEKQRLMVLLTELHG